MIENFGIKESKKESLCEYLCKNSDGFIPDLEKFDRYEVERLCKLGFLTRGMDSRGDRRYKLTMSGKGHVRLMCTQERVESALDTVLEVLV